MKVFKVYRIDGADYDEFDSAVVVAEDGERAIEIIWKSNTNNCWGKRENLRYEFIDTNSERIVVSSFNAG